MPTYPREERLHTFSLLLAECENTCQHWGSSFLPALPHLKEMKLPLIFFCVALIFGELEGLQGFIDFVSFFGKVLSWSLLIFLSTDFFFHFS